MTEKKGDFKVLILQRNHYRKQRSWRVTGAGRMDSLDKKGESGSLCVESEVLIEQLEECLVGDIKQY